MAEDGLTFQHKVRGNILAWRLNIGDAGLLFLRRDWVVDFDCVLTGEQIREGQMLGAVICGACETIYRLDDEPIWVVYVPKKPYVYATGPPFA